MACKGSGAENSTAAALGKPVAEEVLLCLAQLRPPCAKGPYSVQPATTPNAPGSLDGISLLARSLSVG